MVDKDTFLSQRYELLTFLGKGGMSEVWKARHIHLDKLFAVKLLHKNLTEKGEFVARFKQEAQISSKLNHPNICGVSDFGFTEEGTPFIVMEYLEGESLATILKRTERLPIGASLSILRQTVSGLQAAHEISVVHRDIKPGNIFILKDKSGARSVKVLDFGISKMLSGKKGDLGLTTTGTLLGTAFYLSPEQIMESRGVDQRTDLYAAGTVLYKLITGKVPYMGENFGEVAVKVVNDSLMDPRDLVKGLPGSVVKVIRKSMEKDPRLRYQNAEAMVRSIDKVLEDYHGDTIDALYKPGLEDLILQPAPPGTSRYGKKVKIAALSTSLSLVIGAIVLFILFTMNHSGNSADSDASSVSTIAAAQNEKENDRISEAPRPEKVKIHLGNMPPGSRFKVGDEEFTGDILEMDRSTQSIKIFVYADGFQKKEITLVPISDLDIDASLKPIVEEPPEDKSAAKTKSSKIKKTGAKKGGSKKPSPDGKKKKSGGMDFAREFPGED